MIYHNLDIMHGHIFRNQMWGRESLGCKLPRTCISFDRTLRPDVIGFIISQAVKSSCTICLSWLTEGWRQSLRDRSVVSLNRTYCNKQLKQVSSCLRICGRISLSYHVYVPTMHMSNFGQTLSRYGRWEVSFGTWSLVQAKNLRPQEKGKQAKGRCFWSSWIYVSWKPVSWLPVAGLQESQSHRSILNYNSHLCQVDSGLYPVRSVIWLSLCFRTTLDYNGSRCF